MRLRCGFFFECRYDSGWNNAQRKHGEFHFVTGPSG